MPRGRRFLSPGRQEHVLYFFLLLQSITRATFVLGERSLSPPVRIIMLCRARPLYHLVSQRRLRGWLRRPDGSWPRCRVSIVHDLVRQQACRRSRRAHRVPCPKTRLRLASGKKSSDFAAMPLRGDGFLREHRTRLLYYPFILDAAKLVAYASSDEASIFHLVIQSVHQWGEAVPCLGPQHIRNGMRC